MHAKGGRFKVKAPARRVTLHLRGPDGGYAGPIVVGRTDHGKTAIVGVTAGAKLGRIKLKARKGYAKVKRKLGERWIDSTREARARKGAPIGAGKLGRVRSKRTHGGAPGDADLDGVPNTLDIDDDGDLTLDDYDRSTRRPTSRSARSAYSVGSPFLDGDYLELITSLGFALPQRVVNVNGGSTDEQIGAAEENFGVLDLRWTGIDPDSGEVDCGTLVYCSKGGTGRWEPGRQSPGVDPTDPRPPRRSSPSAAISTRTASSIGFLFSTFPVLDAYDDGQGDSGGFSYPRPDTPCVPSQTGFDPSSSCAVPARAAPNGDVVLTLSFWRPQRQRIEGEDGEGRWIDVGNLAYGVSVALQPEHPSPTDPPPPGGFCRHADYTSVDPSLTPLPIPSPGEAQPHQASDKLLGDVSGDRPASPENTFTDTLNLTQCLASYGASLQSASRFTITIWAYALTEGAGPTPLAATANSTTFFQMQP